MEIYNLNTNACHKSWVLRMRILVFIVLLFCFQSYASEMEFNCRDIAVAPDGMAWDPNAQGQLITGVVVCESENSRKQTQYLEGFKHGKEYIIYTNNGGEKTNTYRKGEKIMECNEIILGKGIMTICENFETGEKTTAYK